MATGTVFKGNTKNFIRIVRIAILQIFCLSKNVLHTAILSKVTIVAPHPDDEAIGCSGLIQRLLKEAKEVHVIILSGGEQSHATCCNINKQDVIEARKKLSLQATAILGLPQQNLHQLNYPDGNIRFNHPETERLQTLLKILQPTAIFIPHRKEGWSDHLEANSIVQKLLQKDKTIPIYEYCVWFWYYNSWKSDWKNAYLLRMNEDEHAIKNNAIDSYIYPKAPCGRPWSGTLPGVFIKANRWGKELYFKIK